MLEHAIVPVHATKFAEMETGLKYINSKPVLSYTLVSSGDFFSVAV